MIYSATGVDRIPLKRSYHPVPGPSGDPGFGPPFFAPRPAPNRQPFASYHRQPVVRPSTFQPRPPPPSSLVPQTNVKSETDFHNSPFPQSQHIPSPAATNMASFPTLVNPTISSQQNQLSDVPLDSLPSLGPEGTSAVLNDSTLPAASVATNFPKLEQPNLGTEFALDGLFQQHCSIEESDGEKSLMRMLQEGNNDNFNFATLLATDANNPANPAAHVQGLRPPVASTHQQIDPRLFNTTTGMSSHQITSPLPQQSSNIMASQHVMSPSPMSNTIPSQQAANNTHLPTNVMSPNQLTGALSPPPNINPRSSVMSPHELISDSMAQVHQTMALSPESHIPNMTPQPSPFYQPQNIQQTEQELNDHGDFSPYPHGNFNLGRNSNNNNYLSSDAREDSLDQLLKGYSG